MKSDTQSNNLRLVDSSESETPEASETPLSPPSVEGLYRNKWIFIGVCVACAVGAVAAGGYAAWLMKKRETESVILDVQDLVQSCEDRVAQIEAQINRLNSASD